MFDKLRTLVAMIFLYALGVTIVILYFFLSFEDTKAAVLYWVIAAMCFAAAAFLTIQYVKIKKRESKQDNAKKRQKQFDKLSVEYNKTESSDIDVKPTDYGDFIFVGKFDLGELGVFDWKKVHIDITCDELKEMYGASFDDKAALKFVTELVFGLQTELKKYGHNLKNYFLYNMLREANMSGNGFWEHYKLKQTEHADNKITLKQTEYSDDQCMEIFESWYNKVIDGIDVDDLNYSLRDDFPVDIETELKANFPFFDYDEFIGGIELEALHFSNDSVSIQLSDKTSEVFCGAFDSFDRDLHPTDWHNF